MASQNLDASTRGVKLQRAINAVKESGFRSTNEFILAYYASKTHSSQSLRYQAGMSYTPSELINTWYEHVPSGRAQQELDRAVITKAATLLIQETDKALPNPSLHVTSTTVSIDLLSDQSFGLEKIADIYALALPWMWLLLQLLLVAPNRYERQQNIERAGKTEMVPKIIVVVISICLYFRNRATNSFQVITGIFLASSGASRRVIDNLNHMGLSVSYQTIQSSLSTLSEDAKAQAQTFIRSGKRLWAVVYDNINFTLRKASQRLDSATQQINATTSAVFSLPSRLTRSAYVTALSVYERNRQRGLRKKLTVKQLRLSPERQQQMLNAFKHGVRRILLDNVPGQLRRNTRRTKKLRKHTNKLKPHIRSLGCEKTEFFPLPALNEEEASVSGTMHVVEKIFTFLLGLATEVIEAELRLLVGDWLTIRNLRLMKEEREDEFSPFLRFEWVQEAAMPFHFQLNAMYALFRTHLGTSASGDPACLEHHRTLLRRSKLDPKKPEYNKARELAMHSLAARILDCARIILDMSSVTELASWKPSIEEFENIVENIVLQYAVSSAGDDALNAGDEVLAHSIFFIRDSLLFWEFCEAVRDADVGRMWMVYDFWLFMMRGAGCHNYGNELLEMKAQFEYELPPLLREVVENTWLVNRWGLEGRSIPTDLYLEHNNGFLKNLFMALGSNASIDHIQHKSSACIEVLRNIAHNFSNWFGTRDIHRRHSHVPSKADITALCLDLQVHQVHILIRDRAITTRGKKKANVVDVLSEGRRLLTERNMYQDWLERTASEPLMGASNIESGQGFSDPDGMMEVNTDLDPSIENSLLNEVSEDYEEDM